MNNKIGELSDLLKRLLIARGFDIKDTDKVVLDYEIQRAIQEINRCRRFEPTKDRPYDEKYEDLIIPLSISAFSKIGAEGQTSHTENGIVRYYTSGGDYPKDELAKIVPLIK